MMQFESLKVIFSWNTNLAPANFCGCQKYKYDLKLPQILILSTIQINHSFIYKPYWSFIH
jgi:hypothetical protein